ncbi:ankyrin repeat domain protein [Colletotrichum musicola]|uniref:Ankyrin repeat domain protein n=1 Tax=Colletotrichum musicola TaxID=2175873 RepID=A0A8H6JEC1_9PEZI|nr:ankyrin repeat domain protein [Colletotrichum musicola]
MANLESLPTETHIQIARYCDKTSELAGIARASRRLHQTFNPELYRIAIKNDDPRITIVAAAKGQLDTLKIAASFSADLNREQISAGVALGQKAISRYLFDAGASHAGGLLLMETDFDNPSSPDNGFIPIDFDKFRSFAAVHTAAAVGNAALMVWLVEERGVDINTTDSFAATPFHYAIMADDPSTVALLLSLGADPWQTVSTPAFEFPDYSPLELAFCYGKNKAATALMEHGAATWSRDPEHGHLRESALKRLLAEIDRWGPDDWEVPAAKLHLPRLIQATCEAYHRAPEDKESLSTELGCIFRFMYLSSGFGRRELNILLSSGELDLEHEVKIGQRRNDRRDSFGYRLDIPYTLGSLSLRSVVREISLSDHYLMFGEVSWLLDRGADPSPIEGEGYVDKPPGPIGHLLDRILDTSGCEAGEIILGVAPVIKILGDSGGWSAPTYDRDNSRYLLKAYF